ncbi:MAG: DinB family protein [Chloroflexota bacterium]
MYSSAERNTMIERIARFPLELQELVASLSDEQLNAKVDHDPWTIAQIVHHCANSHMNSFVRLKLVLTEERPPLKGYDQDAWALMADENSTPIDPSLTILKGLHQRWVTTFYHISEEEWGRVGLHSEDGEMRTIDLLTNYVTHCDEHIDQIKRILAALEN